MAGPYRGEGLPQEARDRLGARGGAAPVVFLADGCFLWAGHRASRPRADVGAVSLDAHA